MPRADGRRGRASFPKVAEQGRKIEYLLGTHGDQRAFAPDITRRVDPSVAVNFASPYVVTGQKSLADALGTDLRTVNKWVGETTGIDPYLLEKMCSIFAISRRAFTALSYDNFVAYCEGGGPDWHRLVQVGAAALPGIRTISDLQSGRRALRIDGVTRASRTSVRVDERFLAQFDVSQLTLPVMPLARCHVLVFYHDEDASHFTYLPEFSNRAPTISERPGGILSFPPEPILSHGLADLGKDCAILVVVSADPFPPQVLVGLGRNVRGAAIEPVLKELAGWLEGKALHGHAIIARAQYVVT